MRRLLMIPLCLSLLNCTSADEPSPDEVNLLADAYAELLILRETFTATEHGGNSAAYISLRDSVLARAGYDEEGFRKAILTLARRPESFRAFSQRVSRQLGRR